MLNQPLFRLAAITCMTLVCALPAAAQNWSDSDERLSRLEDEVNSLRQRGAGGGAGAGLNSAAASQLDARLTQLETQVRDLTGQIERSQYQSLQNQNRLERLAQDIEVRFQEMQRMQAQAAATPAPAPAPAAAADTATDEAPAEAAAETKAPANSAAAQEIYDEGFAKLRQADYAGAEKSFRKFLDGYSSHQLAGNASYWLGETYYVRGKFKEAAVTFADGYQKYPKNSKAPDNLLKLAMALGNLGSKDDACLTLGELKTKYPTAAPTIRTRADQERKKLACKA